MPRISPKPGFTLAELLIALALLGIIAAFTIPKVLQAHAEQEKVAKLRETVAAMESAWQGVKARGAVIIYAPGNYPPADNYLGSAGLNLVQHFPYPFGQPVLPPGHPCMAWGGDWGSYQFHNSVFVHIMNDVSTFGANANDNAVLCIDINSNAPPNLPGQDAFIGTFSITGDFDGVLGGAYTPGENRKNFLWGSLSDPPRDNQGNPVSAPWDDPQSWVGTWITR